MTPAAFSILDTTVKNSMQMPESSLQHEASYATKAAVKE